MGEREAAHGARCHLHIRDLAGHADDEGEVKEIPIVGKVGAREGETAAVDTRAAPGIAIVVMSVVEREDGVRERPPR